MIAETIGAVFLLVSIIMVVLAIIGLGIIAVIIPIINWFEKRNE